MIILKNSKELYSRFLFDITQELPSRVFIATYGLWCGINSSGCSFPKGNSYRLLDYLNSVNDYCKTTIIVGYDNFISEVLVETATRFDKINFVAVRDFHSKCILTSTGILSVGSSNLNDSDWWELNMYDRVPVDSPEYLDIHHNLELMERYGDKINRIEYPKVDISEIVGEYR